MGRPKGVKNTKPRTRRTDERDIEITMVILHKRELEIYELEALMQVAPNGITPAQIQRQSNADEKWILENEPAHNAQDYTGGYAGGLRSELKSFARHNVGAIIYDEEE
jgi:hypothetical protein